MSRALLIIANDEVRARALSWVTKAPLGTRLEFKEPKRTLPQNARLHAMLTDVARQKEHGGRKYDVDTWKAIFVNALGRETRFVPNLDGTGFLPIGLSSSDLSKDEFSGLIELLFSWGAEHGVVWSDPTLTDADPRHAQRDAA